MLNCKRLSGLVLGLLCASTAAWGGNIISYYGVQPDQISIKPIVINHGPTVAVVSHVIKTLVVDEKRLAVPAFLEGVVSRGMKPHSHPCSPLTRDPFLPRQIKQD